jgi:hypothetical protein
MLWIVVHWGDVARWLVEAAPLLVGGVVILLLRRRQMARPWSRPVHSGRYSLRKLAAALVIVLIVDTVAWLGVMVRPALGSVSNYGFSIAVVMFLFWFYRARVNAESHGWPQRRSPGLAIWAWFVPVVNFYFPFQIMVDIWRAGLPEQARSNRAILPGIWWASLLAVFCLLSLNGPMGPAHRVWYVSLPIYGTGVLAVVTTALLVQKVSSGPVGLEDGDARLVP